MLSKENFDVKIFKIGIDKSKKMIKINNNNRYNKTLTKSKYTIKIAFRKLVVDVNQYNFIVGMGLWVETEILVGKSR